MSDTATLRTLSIKVLKARAASHGITAPAGHKGKKATWIAAIQQAEGSGGGGGWKPDVEAEWEVVDGRMGVGRCYHTAAVCAYRPTPSLPFTTSHSASTSGFHPPPPFPSAC